MQMMACCVIDARNRLYLPKELASIKENYETEYFPYNHEKDVLDCKLLTKNPYLYYFQQVYPNEIHEHELNKEMIDVLKSYTDSHRMNVILKPI